MNSKHIQYSEEENSCTIPLGNDDKENVFVIAWVQLKYVCTVCACEVHLYRKVNGVIPCEYWQDWRKRWGCAYDVKRHKKVLESCGFIFKLIDYNLKIIPQIFLVCLLRLATVSGTHQVGSLFHTGAGIKGFAPLCCVSWIGA